MISLQYIRAVHLLESLESKVAKKSFVKTSRLRDVRWENAARLTVLNLNLLSATADRKSTTIIGFYGATRLARTVDLLAVYMVMNNNE